jgi:hypothetical protein
MADIRSKRIKGGDEENSGFGLPARIADHRAGFEHKVAKQEVETGKNRRLRPSKEKEVPKESLAARIRKSRKGG